MPGRVTEPTLPLDEHTELNYLKWNDLYKTKTAFQTSIPLPSDAPDQRRHNLELQQGDEKLIRDVRGCAEQPALDTHGFQSFQHKTVLTKEQYYDPEAIRNIYLPEFVTFLRDNLEGADHIVVFDWRYGTLRWPWAGLRRHAQESRPDIQRTRRQVLLEAIPSPTYFSPFAETLWIEYTDTGTLRRIERHVGKDCWKLLRGRLRMISMWRPLNGPVRDYPLALCDSRTYDQDALIPMDTIRPRLVGQSAAAQYRADMKWYYKSRHMNDEVVMFKNFDSNQSVARFTVHTAFKHSCIPSDVQPRESIECRALVFTCPDGDQSVRYKI